MSESDTKYHTIFSHYLDVVLLVDPDTGVIKEANQAARRFLRYDKGGLAGQHVSLLFPRDAGVDPKALVEKLRIHGHLVEGHHVLLGTGDKVAVELSATMFDLDHEAVVLISMHDATERLQAEQEVTEVRALNARVKSLSKAYDEINGPLQELLSLIEVQGRERLKRPLKRIAGTLNDLRSKTGNAAPSHLVTGPSDARASKWQVPCTTNRVLIVDDEIDIRNLFNHILRTGIPEVELDMASDGEDAVRAFQEGHHAVILLDLNMPRMTGDKAFEKIEALCRENYWQMPTVILCTCQALQESLARVVDPELPHSCLLKPVPGSELVEVVKQRLAYSLSRAPGMEKKTPKAAAGPQARVHLRN